MGAPPLVSAALAAKLYDRSQAARWGLTNDQFTAALNASVAHGLAGLSATGADIDRYVGSLHLEDLALAAACAEGSEAAWQSFIAEYRPALYRAADAIAPAGDARELADSLYADLFGLHERDDVRQSLFRYFHGRSRLATWLRAVLSQRLVDRFRSRRRFEPLPEGDAEVPAVQRAPDPERPRFIALMRRALADGIAALAPRDRLRLSLYYAQDLTLSAIGRMLHEHEATVSRHLTRTRAAIRGAVEACLRTEHGLDDRAIAECFESVVDDPGGLDLDELVGDRKKSDRDRSS